MLNFTHIIIGVTLFKVLIHFTVVVIGLHDGRFIDLGVVDVADCLKALILVNDLFSMRLAAALVSRCGLLRLWGGLGPALLLLLFLRFDITRQVNDFFLGDLMVFRDVFLNLLLLWLLLHILFI